MQSNAKKKINDTFAVFRSEIRMADKVALILTIWESHLAITVEKNRTIFVVVAMIWCFYYNNRSDVIPWSFVYASARTSEWAFEIVISAQVRLHNYCLYCFHLSTRYIGYRCLSPSSHPDALVRTQIYILWHKLVIESGDCRSHRFSL